MKLNLLILPEAFPSKDGKDNRGVFIKDYASSVLPHCNVQVVRFKKSHQSKIIEYKTDGYKVFSYHVYFNEKYKMISKIFYFFKIYILGYRFLFDKFKEVDLIHVHGSLFLGNIANKVAKKLSIPYIISEHTGPFSKISNNFIKLYLSKKSIQNANALLCVSKDLKQQINSSGIFNKNTHISYNPVNTDLFTIGRNFKDYKNIIFVGRLEDYKGGMKIIKVFYKLSESFSDWSLTIIGDGSEMQKIKNFIDENNLKNRIFLKGEISKNMISNELKKASFFVFPSLHETFGIVIAEAMASGLPVITSNTTAPKEFVNESSGILIDPKCEDDLHNAMKQLMRNYVKYDRNQIRDNVVKKFGFDSFGLKLKLIYEGLTK